MVRRGLASPHALNRSSSETAAPTPNEMFHFGLMFDKNDKALRGLQFSGQPPRIHAVDEVARTQIKLPAAELSPPGSSSALLSSSTMVGGSRQPSSLLGLYFVALQLVPDDKVEIVGVENASVLMELIREYSEHRVCCLILSSHPPPDVTGQRVQTWLDGRNHCSSQNQQQQQLPTQIRCLYKFELPAFQDLGIKVSGYPPALTDLTPDSPLNRSISHLKYKTLLVDSIVFPCGGQPDLSASSSVGFDATTIVQWLEYTKHMEGRQLVLKEVIPAQIEVVDAKTRGENQTWISNGKEHTHQQQCNNNKNSSEPRKQPLQERSRNGSESATTAPATVIPETTRWCCFMY